MQKPVQKEITDAVREKFGELSSVKWAALRRSWMILRDRTGTPHLMKCMYFQIMAKQAHPAEQEHVDIVVATKEATAEVREWLRIYCGLKPFEPGNDDPESLLEVWA